MFSKDISAGLTRKIALATNPQDRMKAMEHIDNVLLQKALDTGELRRYMRETTKDSNTKEGMRIIGWDSDLLYPVTTSDLPHVLYEVAPDPESAQMQSVPRAYTSTTTGPVRARTFQGFRYFEGFSDLKTDEMTKPVDELHAYRHDVAAFFENYSLKSALDKESNFFFRVNNKILNGGRSLLASKNIMAVHMDEFTVSRFSSLKDKHRAKHVPHARLISYFAMLNESERTVATEIENLAYQGITSEKSLETFYGLTPLEVFNKKYLYYSFDIAHKTNLDEKEQFFIDLDQFTHDNVADMIVAHATTGTTDANLVESYMEEMGYLYTAPTGAALTDYGNAACQAVVPQLDASNYTPVPPIDELTDYNDGTTTQSRPLLIGAKMMRSYTLPPRRYWGHFDLFGSDMKTIIKKDDEVLRFYSKEKIILTAKNIRAVTTMDVWQNPNGGPLY